MDKNFHLLGMIEYHLASLEKEKFNLKGEFAEAQKLLICRAYKKYFDFNFKYSFKDVKELFMVKTNIKFLGRDGFNISNNTILEQMKNLTCKGCKNTGILCGFQLRQQLITLDLDFFTTILIDSIEKDKFCLTCEHEECNKITSKLLKTFNLRNKNIFLLIKNPNFFHLKSLYKKLIKNCNNLNCRFSSLCLNCTSLKSSYKTLTKLKRHLLQSNELDDSYSLHYAKTF